MPEACWLSCVTVNLELIDGRNPTNYNELGFFITYTRSLLMTIKTWFLIQLLAEMSI